MEKTSPATKKSRKHDAVCGHSSGSHRTHTRLALHHRKGITNSVLVVESGYHSDHGSLSDVDPSPTASSNVPSGNTAAKMKNLQITNRSSKFFSARDPNRSIAVCVCVQSEAQFYLIGLSANLISLDALDSSG